MCWVSARWVCRGSGRNRCRCLVGCVVDIMNGLSGILQGHFIFMIFK